MQNYNEFEVLLVEDNPNDAELIMRALKTNNFANKIYWVKDGEEALEFIFCTGRYVSRNIQIPPKVILLDLKLPKIDGLEVLARVKADERTKSTPVVVVTSSQENSDLEESYRLGVNSYIVKPVDFDKFVKALSSVGLYWLAVNKPPIK
ncbi:MAG: two-component system response regulator [Candidatus Colwellbacteria bacterium RIFCSPLOWO2_01_FULL_48_10]|uniref:Two-component system response regulator n=2 Tax=Bacteria candidate phyla TaxID=1783234 RepID=A0A1F5P3Q8_9BACT|nr:MAG: two-component system response regulator [Candidatus Doudnabacteria bacterium RIFCSPHIGHO2_01_FULL_49_9]OGY59262.1 MAG: two-component system response regulator [Candidatus Colwellbacteria bacterium RIFCSPLOWO2_01_FULL_48_10]